MNKKIILYICIILHLFHFHHNLFSMNPADCNQLNNCKKQYMITPWGMKKLIRQNNKKNINNFRNLHRIIANYLLEDNFIKNHILADYCPVFKKKHTAPFLRGYIQLSPDAKNLLMGDISSTHDLTITIYELENLKIIKRVYKKNWQMPEWLTNDKIMISSALHYYFSIINIHTDEIHTFNYKPISWSPSNKKWLDSSYILFDCENLIIKKKLDIEEKGEIFWSKDETYIGVKLSRAIFDIYSLQSGKKAKRIVTDFYCIYFAFSLDNSKFFTCESEINTKINTFNVYDINKEEKVFSSPTDFTHMLIRSPFDTNIIIMSSSDGQTVLYDTSMNKIIQELPNFLEEVNYNVRKSSIFWIKKDTLIICLELPTKIKKIGICYFGINSAKFYILDFYKEYSKFSYYFQDIKIYDFGYIEDRAQIVLITNDQIQIWEWKPESLIYYLDNSISLEAVFLLIGIENSIKLGKSFLLDESSEKIFKQVDVEVQKILKKNVKKDSLFTHIKNIITQ